MNIIDLSEEQHREIWEKIFPTREKAHDHIVRLLQTAFSSTNTARLLCNQAELGQQAHDELVDIMERLRKALLPL